MTARGAVMMTSSTSSSEVGPEDLPNPPPPAETGPRRLFLGFAESSDDHDLGAASDDEAPRGGGMDGDKQVEGATNAPADEYQANSRMMRNDRFGVFMSGDFITPVLPLLPLGSDVLLCDDASNRTDSEP